MATSGRAAFRRVLTPAEKAALSLNTGRRTAPLAATTDRASQAWPLPGDPVLSQDVFRTQVVLLAPGANQAGAVSTRGLRLTLGNR